MTGAESLNVGTACVVARNIHVGTRIVRVSFSQHSDACSSKRERTRGR